MDIFEEINYKHKNAAFNSTPQQDIDDAIQGIKIFDHHKDSLNISDDIEDLKERHKVALDGFKKRQKARKEGR